MRYLLIIALLCSAFLSLLSQKIELNGQVKIIDGSQGQGRILTSDSLGNATWSAPSVIPYPDNPKLLFQSGLNICETFRDWIELKRPIPDSTQVVVGGIDMSLTSNAFRWNKIIDLRRNRIAISSNAEIDAFNFLAIEKGVHTIDGKMVQAGNATSIQIGDTISFHQPFSAPPVVYVFINGSASPSASTIVNVRNTSPITANNFIVGKNNNSPEAIFWVAMDPGTYNTPKWNWYVERIIIPPSTLDVTVNFPANFFSNIPDGFCSMEANGGRLCAIEETNAVSSNIRIQSPSSATMPDYLHVLYWEENY